MMAGMKVIFLFAWLLLAVSVRAEEGALNASQLAAKMAALVEDGDSTARVRMKNSRGEILQVQIKSRRGNGGAQTVYEILWPQERKGEKVALRQSKGSWPQGEKITVDGQRSSIGRGEWTDGMFGSDLSYADAVENFFLWPRQELAGKETVGRTECVILESGSAGGSPHGKVRSWIDTGKWTVMRVEKHDASGKLVRTITTTQVAKDDKGRNIPAGMTAKSAAGSSTEIDGSNIRHDVKLSAADLAP